MNATLSRRRVVAAVAAAMLLSSPASVRAQITLPADPPPVDQFARRTLHQPPALTGSGAAAKASVAAFLAWAGMSAPSERDDGRRAIAEASSNPEIAKALCREAMRARHSDNSRALLVLAVLGELKNAAGQDCLLRFLAFRAPKGGPIDRETGELELAQSLELQQAKAVDGLAYLRSEVSDALVLDVVARHPSRAVRAEAIEAYLWNHGDSPAARNTLLGRVQPGDDIFLDRIRREDGDSVETFDAKIDAFLRAHPEREGDAPVPTTASGKSEMPNDPGVPPVDGFVFGPTCGATAPVCDGTCGTGQRCVSDPLAGCVCQ